MVDVKGGLNGDFEKNKKCSLFPGRTKGESLGKTNPNVTEVTFQGGYPLNLSI